MMDRCYNKSSRNYNNWGGAGVVVIKRWHDLDNFIEDIDSIEGWDKAKYMKGGLSLDKDMKDPNNKIYSLKRVQFVTVGENNKVKPHQQHRVEGTSPSGKKFTFTNQRDFAKTHK